MKLRLIAPFALLLSSSACFATRNDVRILQEDILSLRTANARADSARAKQLADLTTSLNTTLVVVRDSVKEVGSRLDAFQGSTRQDLRSLGQQLLQLGELMGQSSAQLQNFKAELEERNRQAMEQALRATAPSTAVPGDTAGRAVAPPPVVLTEGPNVLYQIGRDQLFARAWSAARAAFSELLRTHPNSDRVPDAMRGIAESYDAEGNRVQGDSVFREVVAKYPNSQAAPPSLYKLGLSLMAQKKPVEARTAMQDVVRKYPRSDESTLATEWLARNPPD
jgi:TolA-binding protein